jgi:hypothetical protein
MAGVAAAMAAGVVAVMAVVPAAAWAVVAISVAGAILAVQWVAEALAAVLEVALGRLLAEGAVLRHGATLTSAGSVSVRDISAGGQDSSAIVIFVFSSSAARAGFGCDDPRWWNSPWWLDYCYY